MSACNQHATIHYAKPEGRITRDVCDRVGVSNADVGQLATQCDECPIASSNLQL
jgi:hypothetical protein